MKCRCEWVSNDPLYIDYHDKEWGVPVYDDQTMFEFLILETFQAGLSWITVLKKRENFRKAFDNFDAQKIAHYSSKKIEKLLNDAGIIRNKLKINATINNAQLYLEMMNSGQGFADYFWSFTDGKPIVNKWATIKDCPAKTALSDLISKDLKKKGFKFVGSTVIYAHLQATGIVNDHTTDCFRYKEVQKYYR